MAAIFQIRRGSSSNTSSLVSGELYLNTTESALQVGTPTAGAPIKLLSLNTASFGDINLSGSITASGDVRIGGNIYLGDNLANDSVNVNSPFSGSIIPSGSNVFDLGSTTTKYRNVYATNISGAIAATNGVISGSSQIAASLPAGVVSGSSQIVYSNISGISSNIVSSSTDTANVDITITNGNISADLKGGVVSSSAQIIDVISSLNDYTGSNNTKWNTLGSVTSSLITSVSNLELNSGSYAKTGSNSFIGNQYVNGNLYLTGSLIPSGNFVYDLGSITNGFGDLYISSASIFMDGAKVIGSDTINLNIGDQFEGGTVFYIANDNSYVLIIDNDDLSTGIGGGTKVASASGSIIGTGESNTNAIISQTGLEQNPARKAYDSIRGNYTDWYLPSVEELYYAAIYSGRLGYGFYWSSTTGSFNYQLVRGDGFILSNGDNQNWPVRAIRKSTTTSSKGLQTFSNQIISGSISMTGNINGINISQSTNLINNRLNILENTYATTASVTSLSEFFNTFTQSVNPTIESLNSYTSSLKQAISASGQDLIIYGNLTVQGTQTSLNVNEVFVEDKTLTLASGSATAAEANGAGIHIAGANVTMSWDNSNNRVLFNTNLGIIGSISSSTIVGLNDVSVASYSSSVNNRLVWLESASGSWNTRLTEISVVSGSLIASASSFETRNTTLATYTGSVNTRLTEVGVVSGSLIASASAVSTSVWHLHEFSSSQLNKDSDLQTYTSSVNNKFNDLQTYTGSVNTRLTEIGVVSGSLIASASSFETRFGAVATISGSLISTASNHENRVVALESTASYLQGTFSTSVDSRLDNLEAASSSFSSSIFNLNLETVSLETRANTLAQVTSSLISATASLYSSASNHEARIDELEYTASISIGAGLAAEFTKINQATASLQAFTASANIRLNNLETTSASVNISIANLNSFSASVTTASLVTSISNLNTFTSSQLTQNSTLATYTSSVEERFNTLANLTGSNGVRLTNLELTTASLNTSVSNINSFTSSQLTQNISLATISGSLISSASADRISIANINVATASLQTTSASVNTSISNINTFTASLSTTSNVQFGSLGIGTTASGVSGEIRATGDIVAYYSSDERLKENITPIENAVDKINQMGGYNYDWKEGFETIHSHKGHDLGVIAQEVQSVLPEVVTERETGYLAVDYVKLVPVLIEAIKELSAKIDRLENK